MRRLVIVLVVAALAWSGWWALGDYGLRTGFAAWAARQRDAGLVMDYSAMRVAGYPFRFDVTLDNPAIADPRPGIGWRAPFLQLFLLAYDPRHLIAVAPHEQTLTLGGTEIALTASDMRASLVFAASPDFVVNRARLTAEAVALDGWGPGTLRVSTDRQGDLIHRVGLEALAVGIPAEVRAALDPNGVLPAAVDRLHLDGTLTLDRRLDRHALEDEPRLMALDIADLSAAWGEAGVTLAGKLTADAAGRAEGRLTLAAQDWQTVLGIAFGAGLVPADLRDGITTALSLIAGKDGKAGRLETTLTFAEGTTRLGPLPLGPAPLMHAP